MLLCIYSTELLVPSCVNLSSSAAFLVSQGKNYQPRLGPPRHPSPFENRAFYRMRDWGNVGTVVAVKEMVWSKSNGCVCVPGFVCGKSCILNEFREAIDCSKILSQIEEVNVPSQGSFNGGHCEFSHIKVSLANRCVRIGADSCKQSKGYRFNCSERTF